MLSIVKSMSLIGLDGYLINVEVDVSPGMPCFEIVGLPDTSVKESKERVKTAIKNSNLDLLSKKIIINLSPANTKKEGSMFDLPIAIGVLISNQNIKSKFIKEILQKTIFIGELSLDGNINKVNGILPICIEAKKLGINYIVLPFENAKEASIIDGISIFPARNLLDVISFFYSNLKFEINPQNINNFEINSNYNIDFSEVKGQENVKRALEISAAGNHNCLLIGSPGTGKTMIAKRLPTILPSMTFEESLEVTKIHSISGTLSNKTPLIVTRPFRNPHHTISPTSLVGGGRIPKPGEISLAHYGVLFLDELPEFNKSTLEMLRIPLEDKKVTISRVNATVNFPCNFMLIASMNPCPCGYFGSQEKNCTCSDEQIKKYINKISGPLLDRIDLHIEVNQVKYQNLNTNNSLSSSQIKKRVNFARNLQYMRYKKYGIFSNSDLTPKLIEKYCVLNKNSKKILKSAFEKFNLSVRAYTKILKVARTIADLDGAQDIETCHIAEAIQYRNLDRKYWGY